MLRGLRRTARRALATVSAGTLKALQETTEPMRRRGRPLHPDVLTPAEWRVVEGVRHGLGNPAIARRLGVGIDAVKFHVSNALQKLALRDRRQLRLWRGARRAGAPTTRSRRSFDMTTAAFGTLAQIARGVADIRAAELWYRDVLGLPHLFTFDTMAFFDCGGVRLMLSQTPSGGESLLYFRVEHLHAHYDALLARGATPLSAPHRVHQHADGREEWLAFIEDNEGRPLGLAETLAPAA